ncbi:ribonuclease HII [Candidatus Saccharibacteria bacterium]|nr:ribonuclease HII [Candidatus Saccharibacteria bacterium]
MIVGIDEVGRGPWAGPLVIGAVVLGDTHIDGLTDSKKLSKAKRETLSKQIIEQAAACALGWVDANEIDSIGLSAALSLATRRAIEQITVPYHEIIIDGTVNFLQDTGKGTYVTTMKKADLLIGAVSAASIIAKVARDDYMAECSVQYEGYGFEKHVGYGTAYHRAMIERFGITPEHRLSFAPVARLAGKQYDSQPDSIVGTNSHIGSMSETAVCDWLIKEGYKIVERNWKTRFCEIDIVANKAERILFIEVKHRKTREQGGGIAAITPRKLRQMRFAASLYLTRARHSDAQLAAVTTTGTTRIDIEQMLLIE